MGMFGDSLRKNSEKILSDVNTKIVQVVTDVYNQAVVFSPAKPEAPYAHGMFINNWFLGINDMNTQSTTSLNMSGADSYSRIAALLSSTAFLGKDGFVTLSNTSDHVLEVENLGWPSGRAPYAPVKQTITYSLKYKI